MSRKLLSARRTLHQRTNDYFAAWDLVAAAATELGARAWLFRSDTNPALHIEFIEWKAAVDNDLFADDAMRELLRALEPFGPADTELWIEPLR